MGVSQALCDAGVYRHFDYRSTVSGGGYTGALISTDKSSLQQPAGNTVTGDEPADVMHYRLKHPSFPHQSTLDQVFDERQFEAFRALGEHIGRTLFRKDLVKEGLAEQARRRFAAERTNAVDSGGWLEELESSLIRRRKFEATGPVHCCLQGPNKA
jgi:hypothetical protein